MKKLDSYVGRIVRLNQQAFRDLSRLAGNRGNGLDNCFLVADVSHEMGQLICYGGNFRVTVGAPDVALI